LTDAVPSNWLQVSFGESALCGRLVRLTSCLDHLRYRIEEYDHSNRMLLVRGPLAPHNRDVEGEIDADSFWVHRSEADLTDV
jgi:hypothetical protein